MYNKLKFYVPFFVDNFGISFKILLKFYWVVYTILRNSIFYQICHKIICSCPCNKYNLIAIALIRSSISSNLQHSVKKYFMVVGLDLSP